jgi:hypothetical protein
LPFCETYGPQGIALGWDRANFSNGYIPFAKDDGFPVGKAFEIPGKMCLRFMYVKSDHDLILTYKVNYINFFYWHFRLGLIPGRAVALQGISF